MPSFSEIVSRTFRLEPMRKLNGASSQLRRTKAKNLSLNCWRQKTLLGRNWSTPVNDYVRFAIFLFHMLNYKRAMFHITARLFGTNFNVLKVCNTCLPCFSCGRNGHLSSGIARAPLILRSTERIYHFKDFTDSVASATVAAFSVAPDVLCVDGLFYETPFNDQSCFIWPTCSSQPNWRMFPASFFRGLQ